MDMDLIIKDKKINCQLDSTPICTLTSFTCLNFEKPIDLSFFFNFFQCQNVKTEYEAVIRLFCVPHANKIQYYFLVISNLFLFFFLNAV